MKTMTVTLALLLLGSDAAPLFAASAGRLACASAFRVSDHRLTRLIMALKKGYFRDEG
jgi:hypothetical protein